MNQHTKTQDSAAMFDLMYGFGNSFKVLGLTTNLDMHEIFMVIFVGILVAINNASAARILTKYGIT